MQRNATQRIPKLYLNNNFKFYILQFFREFNFLSVFIRFAKTLSLRARFCGHVAKRSNPNLKKFYTNWIAWRLPDFVAGNVFAHVVRLSAMTIKNNFANLNNNVAVAHCVSNSEKKHTSGSLCVPLGNHLLSHFLTSINFDSLSRKIKNPCLVINTKFILRSSYMNNKKIILIVLSVLMVAFISCKDKGTAPTFKVSDIAGSWSGDGVSFTIDNNGNVKMTMAEGESVDISFQIPEADWNSEKTEYTIKGEEVGLTGASITFKSDTSGTATGTTGTTDIKKQ